MIEYTLSTHPIPNPEQEGYERRFIDRHHIDKYLLKEGDIVNGLYIHLNDRVEQNWYVSRVLNGNATLCEYNEKRENLVYAVYPCQSILHQARSIYKAPKNKYWK